MRYIELADIIFAKISTGDSTTGDHHEIYIIALHATPNAWLINSVLSPHLDAFIAYLQSGRYSVNTTRAM